MSEAPQYIFALGVGGIYGPFATYEQAQAAANRHFPHHFYHVHKLEALPNPPKESGE